MLHLEYPCRQGVGSVAWEHGDGPLGEDGARVVLLIHEMYGGTRKGRSGSQDCLVDPVAPHPLPSERREESRMDVQDAPGKCPDHLRRNEAEIAGQEDHPDAELLQGPKGLDPHFLQGPALHRNDPGGDTLFLGPLQSPRLGTVTHQENDAHGAAVSLAVQQRLEVGAPPRSENRHGYAHVALLGSLASGRIWAGRTPSSRTRPCRIPQAGSSPYCPTRNGFVRRSQPTVVSGPWPV